MARRKRAPITDRTYRFSPGPVDYSDELLGLVGDERVVIWMPEAAEWKRGYLVGLVPSRDTFRVKWTKSGFGRNLKGIWRVHAANLFTASGLPVPLYSARLPQSTNTHQKGATVAPRAKKAAAKPATRAKKGAAKKVTSENGTGRTRDKLSGLSEAKKRNIAKLIKRERSKKPATSWDEIIEMVQDKYDWTLPGSMTGRRLLREYAEDGESAIIQQTRDGSATKAKPKTKRKKAAEVEEEDEDEEELEDEDEEDEDEDEPEDEADEDEDEEEEEEPQPKRRAAKKVTVRRGRGKKANPSK